jgi:hypothetical protein
MPHAPARTPRQSRRLLLPLAAALFAACSSGAPSPSPSPDPSAPPDAKVRLRVTAAKALPPQTTFNWVPSVLITLDGRVLSGGAVPAIFPGPLVNPVIERRISANGWARIVTAAREAGLLGGLRDFTGGAMAPGSVATRLELVTNGRVYELLGDASRVMVCITAPCNPQPGTPEAFGGFLNRLTDLAGWLGADIGPEAKHVPAGYAVLVGPPPDDQGLAQPPIAWPLVGGFATFGKPLADGSGGRCGTVVNGDAGALRPAFTAAKQTTKWRDPADGTFHGLVVRPLFPGDGDPCAGLV